MRALCVGVDGVGVGGPVLDGNVGILSQLAHAQRMHLRFALTHAQKRELIHLAVLELHVQQRAV